MSVTINDNPTYKNDAADGTSWRGSREQHLNVSAAVPSYRQATTTYRAPTDAESLSNPSYRVATDEVGPAKKPGAGKGSGGGGGGGFASEHRSLVLIVLCIALGVLCIILLALAINYGIAYQDALKATAAPSFGRVGEYTGPSTTTTLATTTTSSNGGTTVSKVSLGLTSDGQSVSKYILTNSLGTQAELVSLGARLNVLRISTPGGMVDVVAGSDDSNLANLQQSILGSVNGRVCSATAWSFSYGGSTYSFKQQQPPSSDLFYMNGGIDGFYTKNYDSYVDGQNRVHFLYNSSSNADSIPGMVWVHAIYQLTASNELIVSMTLNTDTTSPVDMCHSVGFNLGGQNTMNIAGNKVQLYTTTYAIDKAGVQGPPSPDLQFQNPTDIYAAIQNVIQYISYYDYTFSAKRVTGKALLARVSNDATTISMEVYSNQPAVRLYVPPLPAAGMPGKNGANYTNMAYFFVQPQQYPVMARNADLNTLMMTPKSEYRQETSYKFSVGN